MNEKQELHCHNCNRYVQFTIDLELNGNHVLNCPNCGHEHCRVVKDGIITADRWDSRNGRDSSSVGSQHYVTGTTTTATSTYTTCTTSGTSTGTYMYDAWMNTTT